MNSASLPRPFVRPRWTVECAPLASDPAAVRAQLIRDGALLPRGVAEAREVTPYWHPSPQTLRLLGTPEELRSVLSPGFDGERDP